MDLLTRPQSISLPLAPVIAGALAFAFAVIVGTLPAALFEGLVMASGLPSLLSAAEPPLGLTARALLTVALVALLWGALYPMLSFHYGRRRLRVRPAPRAVRPVKPAAAPPPPPISAHEELGAPFLSVRAPAKPEPVTETVEIADSVFITERRRHPRTAPAPAPQPTPEPATFDATVTGLLARLEAIIAAGGFIPQRPPEPALRQAIHALAGLRRAG